MVTKLAVPFASFEMGDTLEFLSADSPVVPLAAVVYYVEPSALALVVTARDPGRTELPPNGSLFWLLGSFSARRSRGAGTIACPYNFGSVDLGAGTTIVVAFASDPGGLLHFRFRAIEASRNGARILS